MGEVYLAQDTKLGRKVALKLINPEHIGSRETVERFLFEARATAAFNHPNIITIYAAGEFEGRPYVALEYLQGFDLRQRLLEGDVSIREAMRIGHAMSSALAEAHRHELLHRDLKPDNVLIADDGTIRVVDFGLAKAIDAKRWASGKPLSTSAGQWVGTPAYMAPEQWLCKAPTPATDIWALGVVLHELVCGRRPYPGGAPEELVEQVISSEPVAPVGRLGEIPTRLATLVNRCLSKDPAARPAAIAVEEELASLLRDGPIRLSDERCPFPGLLPFSEEQAPFFHGREQEILAFVERMRRDAVLPVVGLSGVGKSSFVQAGVLPHLREQRRWVTLHLRPGHHPFVALASKLLDLTRNARDGLDIVSTVDAKRGSKLDSAANGPNDADLPDDPATLAQRLYESPPLLGLCLRQLAERTQSRVLLFVDQLEEIFALVEDPVCRARFTRGVCSAVVDNHDPVRVVFTLRDDFIVRLPDSAEVRDALRRLTVLRTPNDASLRQALEQPLEAVGYAYDNPGLVEEMIGAVRGEVASLPLLQFSARMLWERRDRQQRRLLRAAYEQFGGVAGALASHADGVLAGLSSTQLTISRQLLLRLVTAEGTRQSLSRRRLLEGAERGSSDVLERLADARLVTVGQGRADDEGATLELAHEALITHWGTLARWVEESRHERSHLAELEQSAELWHKRGRRWEETWSGAALTDARQVADRHRSQLPTVAVDFIEAGERAHRRRLRRRRLLLGSIGVVLIAIAAGSLAVAWVVSNQEQRARRQRQVAEHQRAVALREAARAASRHGELLEARARLRLSLEGEDSVASRALWLQLRDDPLQWVRRLPASGFDVAFSADGSQIAVGAQDGVVYLVETRTRRLRRLPRHSDQVLTVALDPRGKRLAAGTRSGEVWLWTLAGPTRRRLDGHQGPVRRVVFSPDGKWLASASWDGTIRLWSLEGGDAPRELRGHSDRVYGLAFSPDGTQLASASYDQTVLLWPVKGGAPRQVGAHGDRVFSVAFSPDGKTLASGGADRSVRLWDLEGTRPPRELPHHDGTIGALAFVDRAGELLAVAGGGKDVVLWDLDRVQRRRTLVGHEAGVSSLAVGPAGRQLASVSFDKSVRLWRLDDGQRRRPRRGHEDRVNGVAFSPDGQTVASASSDQTIRLWDARSGRPLRTLRGHENGVIDVAYSSNGRMLASSGWDNAIHIWSSESGRAQRVLLGHTGEIHDLQFAPNGRHLISASWDRSIRIWNVQSGALHALLRSHRAGVRAIRLSPDGRLLASGGGDRAIQLRELDGGKLLHELLGHTETVTSLDFAASGERLLSGSYDGTVRLWDLERGSGKIVGRHDGRVYAVALHPSGALAGSAGANGEVRLWQLESGDARELVGHRSTVGSLAFSPDGQLALTGADDGSVRLWRVDKALPLWQSVVVASAPPRLKSHRGWVWGREAPAAIDSLDGVRLAVPAEQGVWCVQTSASRLELWRGGERLISEPLPQLNQLIGQGGQCLAVTHDGLLRFGPAGLKAQVSGIRSIARVGQRLALARDDEVLLVSRSGATVARFAVTAGITALHALADNSLIAGFEDGHVSRIGAAPERPVTFGEAPASAVTRFANGPRGTLFIGFANGEVGLWQLQGGPRLEHARIHGPITQLSVHGRRLYAASELGDVWTWDLEPFYLSYCSFMQQVWRRVPIAWRGGMAELRSPPVRHSCKQGVAAKEPKSTAPAVD
jgi:WD40 repeat protein